MKYHQLVTPKKKSAKRVGRGISSGQGKTAGRGTKGQLSRTGSSKKPGFEGGQTPLMRRLPKLRGFKAYKPRVENVYTNQLDAFAGKTVNNEALAKAGLLTTPYGNAKLIVKGEVTKKVHVKLQGASKAATAAVQKAGGTFEQVPRASRPTTQKKP